MARRGAGIADLDKIAERMTGTANGTVVLAAKLLRIRDRHGRVQPLVANAAQQLFEARRGRQNVVLKARQMGMTTWITGRFFLRTICLPGTTTLMVAHTREAAESLFAIARRMWEELPEELREGPLRLRYCNTGQMQFAETGSEFRVASAGDAGAGRGLSVQNLHCSEVSRWPGDAEMTLAGLRAALTPEGELVLESTPNGAYGAFYEAWRGAQDPVDGARGAGGAVVPGVVVPGLVPGIVTGVVPGLVLEDLPGALPDAGGSGREDGPQRNGMVRHFLPWWLEPAYAGPAVRAETMTRAERQLVERHGLSARQIGFRRGLERSYGMLRRQEFAEDAESCFRTTGTACFELEVLEQRLQELREPAARWRNGALLEWFPPLASRRYVLGVDTAGGGEDGDFAVVQVVDLPTGMQCAELRERLRPRELATVCAEMARAYSDALVAVERNNHGAAVLAHLEMRGDVRLYAQNGQAGWLTSAASKPEMIARLGTLLQEAPERFFSKRLLGECRTFVLDAQGRAAATGGAHDDLVMAMAIAQAVRAEVWMKG